MTDQTPLKHCSGCGGDFPPTVDYFRPHKAYKDGLRPQCRECMRAYDRAYGRQNVDKLRQRKNNQYNNRPDVIAAREQRAAEKANQPPLAERRRIVCQRYRENHPEALRRSRQGWKERNPEKVYADHNSEASKNRSKRWAETNPDKRLAIVRRYHRNHREIALAAVNRRRARKLALPDTWTPQDWLKCLEYWHYTCAACDRSSAKLRADHWIPLAYNGADNPGTVPENMVCLCNSCNASKSDKHAETWLLQKFGADEAADILARIAAYFVWVKGEG